MAHIDLGPQMNLYDSMYNFFDNLISNQIILWKSFSIKLIANQKFISFGESDSDSLFKINGKGDNDVYWTITLNEYLIGEYQAKISH